MSRAAAELFRNRADALSVPRLVVPRWQTTALLRGGRSRCRLCGSPLASEPDAPGLHAVAQPLIPPIHGGSHLEANLVLCCRPCARSRGDRDLLDSECRADREGLKEQRLIAARTSWNHLPQHRDGLRGRQQVDRLLNQRWAYPRATVAAACYAEGGFFMPLGRHVTPHVHLLLHRHEATEAARDVWTLAREAFLDCAWDLIEGNAWLRRVPVQEGPHVTLVEDDRDAGWWVTHRNPNGLIWRA